MAKDETSIFDQAEVTTEPMMEDDISPSDEVQEAWNPTISDESPRERLARLGEKKEANGRTLTIKETFFTRPKTKNPDGTTIEPKKTQDGLTQFYPGKLGIRFEEENLVEYYPNFHYFLNDKGEVSKVAKINRSGENSVTKIFNLVVKKMGKEAEDVSDAECWAFLKGKKVRIETSSGKYMGKPWFRNDIVAIL